MPLCFVLEGRGNFSPILREENRGWGLQDRILKKQEKIFEIKGERMKFLMYIFRICTHHQMILVGLIKRNEVDVVWSTFGGGRRCYRVRWGNLKERVHLEGLVVDGKIKIIRVFSIWNGCTWIELLYLKLLTRG